MKARITGLTIAAKDAKERDRLIEAIGKQSPVAELLRSSHKWDDGYHLDVSTGADVHFVLDALEKAGQKKLSADLRRFT